jgi:hypothetical protein
MGNRPDGGYLAGYALPRPDSAAGVWSLRDVGTYQRAGLWPATDPYFSSTTLLLHGRGSNGSTTIIDTSASARSVTATGATISSTQSKWSTTSISLGTLSIGATPANLIGTADFTIESWIYLPTGYNATIGQSNGCCLQVGTSGAVSGAQAVFRASGGAAATTFCSFAYGQWHHLAVMRSGATGYLFLNGVLAASAVSVSGTNNWTTAAIANASTALFAAEIRFTTAARYATTGFAAPRGAFADR